MNNGTLSPSASPSPSASSASPSASGLVSSLRSPQRGRLSNHSKKRRQALLLKQQQQREGGLGPSLQASSSSSSSSSQASLLWTILLLGLCFCLADVAYILHYVETQQQQQQLEPGGTAAAAAAVMTAHAVDEHHDTKRRRNNKKNNNNQRQNNNNNNAYDFKEVSNSGLDMEEEQIMEEQLHQHDLQVNHQKELDLKLERAKHKRERGKPLSKEEWDAIQKDKQHLLQLFRNAKIDVETLDPSILRELPSWREVTDLYGTEPKIYGLDQCSTFQTHSESWKHLVSTAGTFNSGTNLMAELLIANCIMMDRYQTIPNALGIRWQVPWGKHTPPGDEEFRNTHKTAKDEDVDAMNILPAVTIRDPYVWMNSMCRIEYTARWHHDPAGHCPNLVPNEEDLKAFGKWIKRDGNIPVHVKYNGFWKHHDSLVHFWNDWYRDYYDDTTMSKLIVRYEDLLFWPQEVTEAVCHCAGGTLRHHVPAVTNQTAFKFVLQSAKKGVKAHGPMETRTGYIKAILKYGSAAHRFERFESKDLEYAKQHLDPEMMDFFHYLYA